VITERIISILALLLLEKLRMRRLGIKLIGISNLFLVCFIPHAVFAQQISKTMPAPKQDVAELECSANLQSTVDEDKARLTGKLMAELNNRQDWFLTGDKQKLKACYIDNQAALELAENQGAMLIDIRDATAYAKLKIPGSINIPAKLLKSKAFLKSKTIILFDNGIHYAQQEKLCQQLRDSGFKSVQILKGGLLGWHYDLMPLQGNRLAFGVLEEISPEFFYTEKAYAHWMLVDISSGAVETKPVIALPLGEAFFKDPLVQKKWLLKLQKIAADKAKYIGEHPIVLLIDQQGKRSEKLLTVLRQGRFIVGADDNTVKSLLQGEKVVGRQGMIITRLKKGIAGYEQFLRNRLAMLSYQSVLNKNRGCGKR